MKESEESAEQVKEYRSLHRQNEMLVRKHFTDKFQSKWQTSSISPHERDATAASLSKPERFYIGTNQVLSAATRGSLEQGNIIDSVTVIVNWRIAIGENVAGRSV